MDSTILQPGRNVWRIAHASRASVLIDGSAFFGAVRRAFLKARRSIFVVGWDIHSRTRLVGGREPPDDCHSPILAELLSELVETRPDLHVYLLLWDFSVVYLPERELFPRLSLQWQTPDRVILCMDDAVPFGSSQHQKLIIVDDALAFSGGLDITQRRWDTPDHRADDPDRVDTNGQSYPPFHDVQMMVDGEAAWALAQLARRRWCTAYGTEPPLRPFGDPWPSDARPDFQDVKIGIARTQPRFGDQEEVREVEALFMDALAQAERTIYLENQFMTSIPIAEHIAHRLRVRPKLEVLAVAPRCYKSWAEASALGNERIRFAEIIRSAGGDRARFVYPSVSDGRLSADVSVHSKVAIIDDCLLRVGSANLNNRSMAVDTECDLVIEAATDEQRQTIADVRNTLLGHHCGVSGEAVSSAMSRHRSLLAVAERLRADGHQLRPIDDGATNASTIAHVVKRVVDPKRPLTAGRIWEASRYRLPTRFATIAMVAAAVIVLGLTLAWHLTPGAELVSRERAQELLSSVANSAWAPVWVLLTYLVAGAIAFPVTVLIVATAATFGPWLGFLYATLGALASALAMYSMGSVLGRNLLESVIGARCAKLQREIKGKGVLAVALVRLVPVAPFTLINLMAGACSIALVDYVAGTLIGMLPGLIAASALGSQITVLLTELSAANVALMILFLLVWIAMIWTAQSLAGRFRRHAS